MGQPQVIDNQPARLVFEYPVHPGDRLHQPMPAHRLIDIHRVQEGLVEPGLVLLRHEQNVVLLGRELLRQLFLAYAEVHAHLGVGDILDPHDPFLEVAFDDSIDHQKRISVGKSPLYFLKSINRGYGRVIQRDILF